MNKSVIHSHQVPQAVGTYSQTVRAGDMANLARFNQIMREYFTGPYPARAAVQMAGLPKGGVVEAEAIMVYPPA